MGLKTTDSSLTPVLNYSMLVGKVDPPPWDTHSNYKRRFPAVSHPLHFASFTHKPPWHAGNQRAGPQNACVRMLYLLVPDIRPIEHQTCRSHFHSFKWPRRLSWSTYNHDTFICIEQHSNHTAETLSYQRFDTLRPHFGCESERRSRTQRRAGDDRALCSRSLNH